MNVETARQSISTVTDPCSVAMGRPMDLVTMGLIDDITVSGHTVTVRLVLTDPMCYYLPSLEIAIRDALSAAAGDGEPVELDLQLDGETLWTPDRIAAGARLSVGSPAGRRDLGLTVLVRETEKRA